MYSRFKIQDSRESRATVVLVSVLFVYGHISCTCIFGKTRLLFVILFSLFLFYFYLERLRERLRAERSTYMYVHVSVQATPHLAPFTTSAFLQHGYISWFLFLFLKMPNLWPPLPPTDTIFNTKVPSSKTHLFLRSGHAR